MMPHRPQTTEGTTASRSITYTKGRAHRAGTTCVSSSAMPTLTGTPMMIPMTELMTVPYRTPIAPKWVLPSNAIGEDALEAGRAEPGGGLLRRGVR